MVYSLASAVGQNFIYYTITQFNPLILTTVSHHAHLTPSTSLHLPPPPSTSPHLTSPHLASPRLTSIAGDHDAQDLHHSVQRLPQPSQPPLDHAG